MSEQPQAQESTAEAVTEEANGATGAGTTSQEPTLYTMILKDLGVVFAAISIWAAAETWYQSSGLFIAQIISIGDALLVGVLIAILAHEWGHYAGAKFSKAVAPRVSAKGLSFFRFEFDYDKNDNDQFHQMTYGAHIAHWSAFLIFFIALPMDSLGAISLVGAIFGFIVFASIIEYNIVKDTWTGMAPSERLAQLGPEDFKFSGAAGTIAGLFAIAALA